MEVAVASVSTLSPHLHPFPSNPLTILTTNRNNRQLFRIKAQKTRKKPFKSPTKTPKPFAEEDAFPSSLPLHKKNPQAIYKDIQRFARQSKLKEALIIMDYLDQQGIPVNSTTFSHLLAACVRTKELDLGREIHTHIRINGLESNDFLRTKLIHMYTSCGSIEDARKVFDECSSKNVYAWNALLRGNVISGKKRYRDVLSTFSEMTELGVKMNVYSFSNVIKSFAGASALRLGLRTHAHLVKNGLLEDLIIRTSLIDMYFKCGKIKLARQVFEEITERDIVVWGTMMAGFGHNRRQWEALDSIRMMISEGINPNSAILTTILPVIGEIRAWKLGKEIHAYSMKLKNYYKQQFVESALIDMYCKCGDMSSGRSVFYGSTNRNIVSWTALMSGYISNGRLDQALRSIVWMQQEGFRPDVVTLATVLPVAGELTDLKRGKELHCYAVKNFFLPNISLLTSLIVMYSKCGVLEYASKLFNGSDDRNVKTWTAMINSYIENGYSNEAICLFRSMQLSKHRPDSVTIARALTVCRELKALRYGKEIHGQILKKNLVFIPFVSAELVKMYGNCGDINSAELVFDAVPVKGSFVWTSIIEVYRYNEMFRDAMDRFDMMVSRGFTPNDFTFMVVLSICDEAGFVDDGLRVFNLLTQRYKLKACQEHYSIVVGLLDRFGRVDEAQRLVTMSRAISSS